MKRIQSHHVTHADDSVVNCDWITELYKCGFKTKEQNVKILHDLITNFNKIQWQRRGSATIVFVMVRTTF
jgi:hypothetical protein